MAFSLQPGSGSGPAPDPPDFDESLRLSDDFNNEIKKIEDRTLDAILIRLSQHGQHRQRAACDEIFSIFWGAILFPLVTRGMASRAILFARDKLIPKVLELEANFRTMEFHKGALFYNTALAFLNAGNDDQFEYYLSMADEEDNLTQQCEGGGPSRGQSNLRAGQLSQQTITQLVNFFADLLNGNATSSRITYEFVFGAAVTAERLDRWRQTLQPLHHFELFRLIRETLVFTGSYAPQYPRVLDNPYIMLRLVKVVTHAAQWVESDVTRLQAGKYGPTLSLKLQDDPDFKNLHIAAGGKKNMAGPPPHGTPANTELQTLISDLKVATSTEQKHWRILRILYIARNATAHTIDPSLRIYTDRDFLLEILNAVIISAYVIRQQKTAPVP